MLKRVGDFRYLFRILWFPEITLTKRGQSPPSQLLHKKALGSGKFPIQFPCEASSRSASEIHPPPSALYKLI